MCQWFPSCTFSCDPVPSPHSTEEYPHPLHMAVAIGKHPGVIKNLVMMFGVDKCDEFNRTPLMFAAKENKVPHTVADSVSLISTPLYERKNETYPCPLPPPHHHQTHTHTQRSSCTALIDCGADVNRQDSSGLTALHVACYHGNKEATNVLLSKRAAVDIRDKMVCARTLINKDRTVPSYWVFLPPPSYAGAQCLTLEHSAC